MMDTLYREDFNLPYIRAWHAFCLCGGEKSTAHQNGFVFGVVMAFAFCLSRQNLA